MHAQISALILAALALLAAAPAALAADCVDITGVNTLHLGDADLTSELNSICDDMPFGLTSGSVTSEHVTCTATSGSGTYQFCVLSLTNIAAQCGDVSDGKFDFNDEHYECKGFVGGDDICRLGSASPLDVGDACLKKRSGSEAAPAPVSRGERRMRRPSVQE